VETELDFSSQGLGAGDAVLIANDISDMGALTRLDISKNQLFNHDGTAAGKVLSDMLAVNSTIQELAVSGNAQFSNSRGGPSFAQALSVGISDNGAILSMNLLNNKIGVDQAKALASILKEHPTLKSLCGNSGEETELDMSGKGMVAGDAIMLVPEIVDNRALTSLNLSSNYLTGYDGDDMSGNMPNPPA
jgi:hypothetical protein